MGYTSYLFTWAYLLEFLFNLFLSFLFPSGSSDYRKVRFFFCLVFASRGLRQGFHEKYTWNEVRRKIFHQENRRWALKQSFEMQSTLRKKCRALRSSVRDVISIYKRWKRKPAYKRQGVRYKRSGRRYKGQIPLQPGMAVGRPEGEKVPLSGRCNRTEGKG